MHRIVHEDFSSCAKIRSSAHEDISSCKKIRSSVHEDYNTSTVQRIFVHEEMSSCALDLIFAHEEKSSCSTKKNPSGFLCMKIYLHAHKTSRVCMNMNLHAQSLLDRRRSVKFSACRVFFMRSAHSLRT